MTAFLQKKGEAMAQVKNVPLLREIYQASPLQLEQVIHLALMQPEDVHYWRAYSGLKRFMSCFVGWHAEEGTIATSAHYDAMVEFILMLLPSQEIGGMADPIGLPEREGHSFRTLSEAIQDFLEDLRGKSA